MKHFAYIVCLALLAATGCKKPQDSDYWTEVHVKAENYVTGEPLDDIFISIIERHDKSLFESEYEAISFGFTDENGEYYFGWKAKRNNKYSYEYLEQANSDKYYLIQMQQFDYLSKGGTHYYTIQLAPRGLLRLNYKNVNCFDENDEFFIHYIYCLDVPDNNIVGNPAIDTRLGCDVDVITSYNPEPIGRYEYKYHIKRNGVTTYHIDSVTVSEGQETEIKIHY